MSKWDDYEPYEGEERPMLPKWAERLIVPAFMGLALAVVAVIGWFVGIMVYVRFLARTGNLPSDSSDDWIHSAGTVGAAIAVVVVITWHFRTKRPL